MYDQRIRIAMCDCLETVKIIRNFAREASAGTELSNRQDGWPGSRTRQHGMPNFRDMAPGPESHDTSPLMIMLGLNGVSVANAQGRMTRSGNSVWLRETLL